MRVVAQILLLLLLSSLSFAKDTKNIVQDANSLYQKGTPYTLKRSYELYTDAYNQAKKNKERPYIYQSLYGIINSGSKLKYNISSYRDRFKVLRLPKYESHTITDEKLVIRFNSNIDDTHYSYFRINNKKIVIDVYGDFTKRTKRYSNRFIKNITIAKYQQAIMRVVLETKDPQLFTIDTWKNTIIFQRKGQKKAPKKTQPISSITSSPTPISNFIRTAAKKTVVIDPGHGGRDSGAIGHKGLYEKKIVLEISKKFSNELKNRGYKVYMTRSTDRYIKLTNRTKFANKKSAHLFISIHANSIPVKSHVHGIETYFLSTAKTRKAKRVAEKENAVDMKAMESMSKLTFLNFLNREKIVSSNKLAIDLQKGMLDSVRTQYSKIRDGGVREGPFWVLVGAQMPAVLVETGFVSNQRESHRLQNSHYQNLLARGLADGVDRFFLNNSGQ